MTLETYLGFCAATIILVLLPGPIVTLVIARSIKYGTSAGLATVAGSTLGNAVLLFVGTLGLSTLLIILGDLFVFIRWLGAVYLIWLGIREWQEPGIVQQNSANENLSTKTKVFFQGILVSVTNPKTILFYIAYFPQFLDPQSEVFNQLFIMSVSLVAIGTIFDGIYALIAGRLGYLFRDARRAKFRNRINGFFLIATGLSLLLIRR